MVHSETLVKVDRLRNVVVARATGGDANDGEYKQLREELMQDSTTKALLPRFIRSYRDLSEFWSFIKSEFSHYDERRRYIWNGFAPLIAHLEVTSASPPDRTVSDLLEKLDEEHVHLLWERALERRNEDPSGAITAARALVESVCKTILDEVGVGYPDSCDLPKLYYMTAEQLTLAPGQHTEEVFKQILGGCQAVVGGLSSVRNRLGDAHGQGKYPVRPAPRHAELAVNLAGTMATFLVRTWEYQKEKANTELSL
jgi:hypothetical protein